VLEYLLARRGQILSAAHDGPPLRGVTPGGVGRTGKIVHYGAIPSFINAVAVWALLYNYILVIYVGHATRLGRAFLRTFS